MNQLFLTVAVLAIILQAIAGAPINSCSKLQGVSSDNRYVVFLEDHHTIEDAKKIIDIVKDYQSSLETSASGFSGDSLPITSQLDYLTDVHQLQGTLSQEAILLVHKL